MGANPSRAAVVLFHGREAANLNELILMSYANRQP